MIAIYGAGHPGKFFYNVIKNYEKIDFFIDKYNYNTFIEDIPVIGLKDVKKYNFKKIYNSVANFEDEVVKDLNGENIITFAQTLKQYPEIIGIFIEENILWLNPKANLLDYTSIKSVRKLLKDNISLNFFDRWIRFRKDFDMDYYPYPTNSLKEQYFIENLIGKSKRFVDCGAYIGDTMLRFYDYNKEGKVICFEPDPANLKILNENSKGKDVLIYPMGVASETKIVRFSANKGSASHISEDGSVSIAVTSLDETIYNFRPDYIKMDIEGFELEALKGAKNIIKDFTPDLAICIYHKPKDLWEIPLCIQSINQNYDFFIRCHAHLCIETVLYCKGKR